MEIDHKVSPAVVSEGMLEYHPEGGVKDAVAKV
jgi:hypothetical protein